MANWAKCILHPVSEGIVGGQKPSMSLKPESIPPVPELTVQVAKAAFPKGNVYLQMRDTLGGLYQDDQFVHLYPADVHPIGIVICVHERHAMDAA